MRFWKIFAWIALAWALVVKRGAGILIKKTSSEKRDPAVETDTPEAESGPTWRRASPTSSQYPGRSVKPSPESSGDSAGSGGSADKRTRAKAHRG